jgi:hypothetical protein
MTAPRLVLAGVGTQLQGLTWESAHRLRLGREGNQDVVLRDISVERSQAEILLREGKWLLRHLAAHERHPTFLNGKPITGEAAVSPRDVIQVGKLFLKVEVADTGEAPRSANSPEPLPEPNVVVSGPAAPASSGGATPGTGATPAGQHIRTSGAFVRVQASTLQSWDQALEKVAFDQAVRPAPGQGMLTLLRANHHLAHIASLEELLHSILADAVIALDAQHGSILLADAAGELHLKAHRGPEGAVSTTRCYSRTLALRCFRVGESLLCRDVSTDQDLLAARSVRRGAMASIISAVLRSPRKSIGVLQLDRGPFQEPFIENDLYLADAIAASVAVGIETAQLVEEQREQFIQTVTTLARAVEMRDQCTGDHTRRVTDYAMLLADEMKLSPMEKYQIQIGTPLHDIGKIGIDDAILRKPGKLTFNEFEFMKTHTVKGAAMLQTICNLGPMIPIVRHHHERWDGSGYPDGLAKDEIAPSARIVAVADAFDAMTSDRPYRHAMPAELAYLELIKQSGRHFDPACVQAFVRLRPKVERLLRG